MVMARILVRASRGAISICKSCSFASSSTSSPIPPSSNRFHSSLAFRTNEPSVLQHLLYSSSTMQRFGISTSANPEPHEKKEQATTAENKEDNKSIKNESSASEQTDESASTSDSQSESKPAKRRRRGTQRTAFSDSDSDGYLDDLSKDDLVKLVTEKEMLLKTKQKEITAMQDKVLRSYAEMENVMNRTKREAENSKKFAIQNFAKALLDVADNLGRASSVVKESFAKIDESQDAAGAVPLLKTLLEGVEMTEKQLNEVFRKFGVEKYDPTNEQFDPNRHNAVFQVPDNSKPAGTAAAVLKSGYTLHDRVIRPAEVGVIHAVEDAEA